jgi:hypothetical protein
MVENTEDFLTNQDLNVLMWTIKHKIKANRSFKHLLKFPSHIIILVTVVLLVFSEGGYFRAVMERF